MMRVFLEKKFKIKDKINQILSHPRNQNKLKNQIMS